LRDHIRTRRFAGVSDARLLKAI